ncbi:Hypothetical predicted protein [Olea europaea subsp. europaea]|uniref:Uncharacterized protein n=1 Tax=Olea europaea subsp. europaea TaxID=158383 RepID=A0A8S0T8G3_OLEEU|nr:Hypothetical predicted protein [Olea europaea subsp. europaea]
MACTPCCLHVIENLPTFLPWPGCVPDMASTPCPRNCPEMPEKLVVSLSRPRHGPHNVSQKLPRNAYKLGCISDKAGMCPGHDLHTVHRNFSKIPENRAASPPWPERLSDMASTPCSSNRREIHENQVASLSCPGHGRHTVSQKLPRNAKTSGCIPVGARTYPRHGLYIMPRHALYTVPKNCPERPKNPAASLPCPGRVPNMACYIPTVSSTWHAHRVPETAQKCPEIGLHPGCSLGGSRTWPTLCAQKCLKITLSPCVGLYASRPWPAHHV